MDIIIVLIVCATVAVCVHMVCTAFGPNCKAPEEAQQLEEAQTRATQEENEMTNALIASLGIINDVFGGVESDEQTDNQ